MSSKYIQKRRILSLVLELSVGDKIAQKPTGD